MLDTNKMNNYTMLNICLAGYTMYMYRYLVYMCMSIYYITIMTIIALHRIIRIQTCTIAVTLIVVKNYFRNPNHLNRYQYWQPIQNTYISLLSLGWNFIDCYIEKKLYNVHVLKNIHVNSLYMCTGCHLWYILVYHATTPRWKQEQHNLSFILTTPHSVMLHVATNEHSTCTHKHW